MNHELIKQLGEQATQTFKSWDYNNGNTIEFRLDREKFAELIVEQCAAIADKCVQDRLDYPGDRIKEHFGIK